jgi:phosphoglycerate dehydrogenase-like enzyme
MTEKNEDRIKVLVAMDFSDELLARIADVSPQLDVVRAFPDVPDSAWDDVEILYTIAHYPEPEQAPRLRWVQLHFAGMDRALQKRILRSEDIIVTSASGIHARQMANYCLMMMMAFNFRLPTMLQQQNDDVWMDKPHDFYLPDDMHRQTLGIVGYGTIGRELARIAQALGMRVLASKRDVRKPQENENDYTPTGTGDPDGEIPDRLYPSEALATMVAECDYVVLTIPLTPQTHHLVNAEILEAMKPSAVLVNVARGSVVDEKALITALSSGQIAGAALDVFEEEPLPQTSPLWNMDNVILSPHVSGNSLHYNEKAADLFVENLKRYLEKRPMLNVLRRDIGY